MTQLSNPDTNLVRSFTEVVTNTVTPSISLTFDYDLGKDGVLVTVDGVDPVTLGYTATLTNKTTLAFSPSIPAGHKILAKRVTSVDASSYVFTSGALFIASNMDDNFKQILKSQQEVSDGFTALTVDFSDTKLMAANALSTASTASSDVASLKAQLAPVTVNGVVDVYTKGETLALIQTGGTQTTMPISGGGTGATTAAGARTNLGVMSTSEVSTAITNGTTGKMDKASNLNDVQDKATSRTNLGVYSKTEVDNKTSQATTSVQGTAKVATAVQAAGLSDDTTIITPAKLTTGVKAAMNAGGNPPIYACRAWVNFSAVQATGTYVQSGTTVTVTITGHALNVGDIIYMTATSGTAVAGSYKVASVVDANNFTYVAGTSLTTSGNITRNLFTRGYGNIAGIIYNAVGDFTIIFDIDMPDANYVGVVAPPYTDGAATYGTAGGSASTSQTAHTFRYLAVQFAGATANYGKNAVVFYR